MSQQYELLSESPGQWMPALYVIPEVQKKEIKPFVILSIKELEGKPDGRISSLTNSDKFSAVRAVVRHVARSRSATKEPWNMTDMRNFLENLKFSPECAEELSMLLCTEQIYENIPRHLLVKPGLVNMSWKIDISLCQKNIKLENANPERCKQIMQRDTHIILVLKLNNGQTNTYRLSVAKFHELRYTIASALKSLIVLEKRKCMRKD
ncbi:uncharacterized protein LSm-4 [Battus philenor]|uniref:uncharacterized protein LSm-4 n=1 Tax=Battus philenor TaxID=42288 RepID=UPI0035D0A0EC